MTDQTRKTLTRQNRLMLVIAVCACILVSLFNQRFNFIIDFSHNSRYSLHADTEKLMRLLEDKLTITAFIDNPAEKKQLKKYIKSLRNYKQNIDLIIVDPVNNPQKARELDYQAEQAIRITYDQNILHINTLNDTSLHNTLQKLLSNEQVWVAFSTGFGERQPYNDANFNYSQLSHYLSEHNFTIIETDLRVLSTVPDNAAVLVIAAPTAELDNKTIQKITHYIEQGGNMLWLADTDSKVLPDEIERLLGVQLLEGILVDANSQKYIENKPDFIPVEQYEQDSFLADMKTVSLFPQVRGLQINNHSDSIFSEQIILQSSVSSWTETGMIRGNIAYDENTVERAGPITIGATFSQAHSKQQDQRIIFLGDADFIANAYIGNGANLNLALRLFRWLTHQQELSTINTIPAPDKNLSMTNNYFFAISLFYIIILPSIFLAAGIWLWYRRKKV